MSSMNQKSAVYAAIVHVLAEAGIKFEDGQNVAPHMTTERRSVVNQILFEGFRSENGIGLTKTFDDKQLKNYVSGLISNWIRKDKRFNGNTAYMPKNPGSRAGSGDATLKNLKLLLSTAANEEDKAEIQKYIDAHLATVVVVKKPSIDFSKLPEALKAKYADTTQKPE